jgi:hypothetical protein
MPALCCSEFVAFVFNEVIATEQLSCNGDCCLFRCRYLATVLHTTSFKSCPVCRLLHTEVYLIRMKQFLKRTSPTMVQLLSRFEGCYVLPLHANPVSLSLYSAFKSYREEDEIRCSFFDTRCAVQPNIRRAQRSCFRYTGVM